MERKRAVMVVAVSVIFLNACSTIAMPSGEQERQISLVTYDNVLQVDNACRKIGYHAAPFPITLIEGCAVYTPTTCVIHMRKPENTDDTAALEVLGHEALHCFAGDWHHDRQAVQFYDQRQEHEALWNGLNPK